MATNWRGQETIKATASQLLRNVGIGYAIHNHETTANAWGYRIYTLIDANSIDLIVDAEREDLALETLTQNGFTVISNFGIRWTLRKVA